MSGSISIWHGVSPELALRIRKACGQRFAGLDGGQAGGKLRA
jgi:hypothetical protein